ncbi:MAG: adenylate kinase [Candidatus Komeilibacteria bacterium]|jgi:adenylate kinase|nr:adenylate kinase [Candidatus Komeilibacteria bacterium]MBT4447205.1 adenylate kinase [Candidatus Komeilibacteria bacterium]
MNIVIIGPQGCGKGTQSSRLVKTRGLTHLSSSDILRHAIQNNHSQAAEIRQAMDSCQLIPDSLMLELVQFRLCEEDVQNGWVLDGFPRTYPQAEGLIDLLQKIGQQIDLVIEMQLSRELCIARACKRLVCSQCNYTTSTCQAQVGDTCPQCSECQLNHRNDDQLDVEGRLSDYHNKTIMAIGALGNLYPLVTVDADGTPDQVWTRILEVLNKHSGCMSG